MEIIPYATFNDCQAIDRETINTTTFSGEILMENAGHEMGKALVKYFPQDKHFFILCGTGNNGGDGLVLARYLIKNEMEVTVGIWGKADSEFSKLFKLNLKKLKEFSEGRANIFFSKEWKNFSKFKHAAQDTKAPIWVDALFGTGLNRPFDVKTANLIKKTNDLAVKRVALDIPSGLSLHQSQAVFKADLTLSVGLWKDVFLYPWFQEFFGKIEIIPLDFPPSIIKKYSKSLKKYFKIAPDKKEISHKNSLSKSLILAGSRQYPGAACLAAKAAVVNGSSYLYLASPSYELKAHNENLPSPEIIPLNYSCAEDSPSSLNLSQTYQKKGCLSPDHFNKWKPQIDKAKHLLIGPGLGREKETSLFIESILSLTNKHIILDADGLWHIKKYLSSQFWKNFVQKNEVLITPHIGEFSDLLGKPIDEVKKNFLQYLDKARGWGCDLLVKDAYLFYWARDSYYFPFPNHYLAKAGSGDILAGFILGSLSWYNSFETAVIQAVLRYIEKGKFIRQRFGVEAPISLMTESH